MILDRPAPFDEALRSLAVKAALPNDLTSAELQQAADVIGGRAVVIAGATNARFADDVRREAMRYLTPQAAPGQGVSLAGSRIALRQSLDRMRYRAPEGGEGGIRDLASEQRLNLVVETQVRMADGYGQFERGQRTAIRYLWPAWELVRKMARLEPRDWPTVWAENGGSFYPGAGPYAEGRMIARKDDPIWTAISRFGLPYPPFDFNSGMGLEGVRRDVCERFGIIRRGQQVEVTSAPFEEGATMPLEISPELQAAVIDRVGPDYEFRDGVLRHVANEFSEGQHPRTPAGSQHGGEFAAKVWTGKPVLASQISGVTPDVKPSRGRGWHVTRRENVDGILRAGFDSSRFTPNWQNDFALALNGSSAKAAMKYVSPAAGPDKGKFDWKKYAVLEVEYSGRDMPERESPPHSASARDYTRQVVESGYDLRGGNHVFVYNLKCLSSIREVKPPKEAA